jgi:hypothetical protein
MSKLTEAIARLVDGCSLEEKREVIEYTRRQTPLHELESDWNTSAEAILTAISRSTDLTQRGVRGILAEATFEQTVIPQMELLGWQPQVIAGDQAYDFVLKRASRAVRIQVKLQRKEVGRPMHYGPKARAAIKYFGDEAPYVVEVQKTRSGKKDNKNTRPYRFGDFDILAVNLHPSTGDWHRFIYTVGNWLIPRSSDASMIDIFQPVPPESDDFWSDDLGKCIEWSFSKKRRTIYR